MIVHKNINLSNSLKYDNNTKFQNLLAYSKEKMYQQSANLKLLNMFRAMLKLSQTSLLRAFEFTLN